MRMIDADALLAKFNKKSDIWTALTDEKTANDFALYCKVADAVEEMPTVGGWISVKDRLPEEKGAYLTVHYLPALGKSGKLVREVYFDGEGWFVGRVRINKRHITHWMPLPEPPKEEP